MKLREFTQTDWDAFAGATATESKPALIADGKYVTVTVDTKGMFATEETPETCVFKNCSYEEGKRTVARMSKEVTVAQLKKRGWTSCY